MSIVVGLIYSVFTANTTYGVEYAGYHFLYTFMFSMIIGELIRATNGRTIYIATAFHASMTFCSRLFYLVKKQATFSQ